MKNWDLQIKNMIDNIPGQETQEILRKFNRDLKVGSRKFGDKPRQRKAKKGSTRKSRILTVYNLLNHAGKPITSISKEDVLDYIEARGEEVSPFTLNNDKAGLKVFFRWYGKPEYTEDLVISRIKNHLPVDNLLIPEDIKAMVGVTEKQRDRALIMLFWDSAARLLEIMGMKVKNLSFDDYGGVAFIDGKTGQRRIRLIDSVPDLRLWLNQHPDRDNPDAPLFVSLWKGYGNAMSEQHAYYLIKKAAEKAGIRKDVSPHKFRHARLTWLAKHGLNEAQLRIIAGWEDDSRMPSVYLHLAGVDVEDAVLKAHGIERMDDEKKKQAANALKPLVCWRCGKDNPHDAKFCNCGQVLDVKAAMEVEEVKEVLREKLTAKERFMTKVESFERMQAEMESFKSMQAEREAEMQALRKEIEQLKAKS